VAKATGQITHRNFFDIEQELRPGDVLVLNNTKVLPARLFGKIADEKEFEVLLLEKIKGLHWLCMARPGKKVKAGLRVQFPNNVTGWVTRRDDDRFEILFEGISEDRFLSWLTETGVPPLPPYIKRDAKK
jgi:S-adenosylmethionine:tRNA ribosyltransferase-isomerase